MPFVELVKEQHGQEKIMWDNTQNLQNTNVRSFPVSHFLPCQRCGHEVHTYLACSDTCSCAPVIMPGSVPLAA
jgi:hypothetical protein